jgi:hypothetical protein
MSMENPHFVGLFPSDVGGSTRASIRILGIVVGCPDGQSAIAAMAVVQLGFAINSLPSIADLGAVGPQGWVGGWK